MLATVSPIFPSVEPLLDHPFEKGFSPWDCFDPLSSTAPDHQSLKLPGGGSCSLSDEPSPNHSDNQSPDGNNSNLNSASDDQTAPTSVFDERKRRRMVSNRGSARRSRMRKQKHLENLRNQVNRLRMQNRELTNRLRFVLYHCHGVRTDIDRLRSENSMLRKELTDIHHILRIRQLQQLTSAWPTCNNIIITATEQTAPSLIAS